MVDDLRRLRRVEASLWFSRVSNRWVSHCAAVNVTAHGPTRELAIEALRRELDAEERAIETYGPPTAAEPVPTGAEIRLLTRLDSGRWSES